MASLYSILIMFMVILINISLCMLYTSIVIFALGIFRHIAYLLLFVCFQSFGRLVYDKIKASFLKCNVY